MLQVAAQLRIPAEPLSGDRTLVTFELAGVRRNPLQEIVLFCGVVGRSCAYTVRLGVQGGLNALGDRTPPVRSAPAPPRKGEVDRTSLDHSNPAAARTQTVRHYDRKRRTADVDVGIVTGRNS